jgi:hypothetical protein
MSNDDDTATSGAKPDCAPLPPEQFDARQVDQDRTLAAVHALEAALAAGAPGRELRWRDEVLGALSELERATSEEAANADLPDSLLSDIKRTQPRLRNRVRGVRAQYRQVRDAIESLRAELVEPDDAVDFADIRERIGWVLMALRRRRARESDLIYEAYYDAFRADLPRDADTPDS